MPAKIKPEVTSAILTLLAIETPHKKIVEILNSQGMRVSIITVKRVNKRRKLRAMGVSSPKRKLVQQNMRRVRAPEVDSLTTGPNPTPYKDIIFFR